MATETNFKEYKAWDVPVRIFHWVNVISILGLIFLGLMILYRTSFEINSLDAKIALKEFHVLFGYVFTVNFIVRIVWGFVGSKNARWGSIFPSKGYFKEVADYISALKQGNPPQFVGHNPLGRLAIMIMVLVMSSMMVTGLTRAATDVYYPPFGFLVTGYIAKVGVDPDTLVAHNSEGKDKAKLKKIAPFKKLAGKVHKYGSYVLMFMIFLHIFFVVWTEIREGGGLISAMFTGKKVLKNTPIDEESVD